MWKFYHFIREQKWFKIFRRNYMLIVLVRLISFFWGQIWIGDILAFSVVLGFLVGEMCILLENVYNLVNKMYIWCGEMFCLWLAGEWKKSKCMVSSGNNGNKWTKHLHLAICAMYNVHCTCYFCKSLLSSIFNKQTCSRFTRLFGRSSIVTIPRIPYKTL